MFACRLFIFMISNRAGQISFAILFYLHAQLGMQKKQTRKMKLNVDEIYNIIVVIVLFILGLKTSNSLQQFKHKNDIKQYSTEMLKN